MIRCASCGASNPDGAAWCGQCLLSLQNGSATSEPVREAGAVSEAAGPAQASTAQASTGQGAVATRGFRRRDDGEMEWACAGCGEYNPLGVDVCAVCATPFAARWAKPPPPPPPAGAFTTALLYSVVLPGTGHLSLHRTGSGVVRLLLFVFWAIAAIVIVSAGGPVLVTAGPLMLGVVAVWAMTIGDILRLRAGEPELFRGRMVVWLVAGVIGLEVVALMTASVALT